MRGVPEDVVGEIGEGEKGGALHRERKLFQHRKYFAERHKRRVKVTVFTTTSKIRSQRP